MKKEYAVPDNLGVWSKYFRQGFDPEAYASLTRSALQRSSAFMRSFETGEIGIRDENSSASLRPDLDGWLDGAEHQNLLVSLVEDVQSLISASFRVLEKEQNRTGRQHLPISHDEWQMAKDVAEAMRFYRMEQPQGYKSLFVIPTAFHDLGRIVEGWLNHEKNPHDNWMPHAWLSFMMLGDVLEQERYSEIPEDLKNNFLYAVLAHSLPRNAETYMGRAVQACDRMQLLGGEGLYRTLAYNLCYDPDSHFGYVAGKGYDEKLPPLFDIPDVLPAFEYITRCMMDNIGDRHEAWREKQKIESLALLCAISPSDLPHGCLPKTVVDCADISSVHNFCSDQIDAGLKHPVRLRNSFRIASSEFVLDELTRPVGAAFLTSQNRETICRKLDGITPQEGYVLSVAAEFRRIQEQKDISDLNFESGPISNILNRISSPARHLYQKTLQRTAGPAHDLYG